MGDKSLGERVLELEQAVRELKGWAASLSNKPAVEIPSFNVAPIKPKPVSHTKVRRDGKWVNEGA